MSKDLYVKNIDPETTEEELRKLFAVCGKVVYVHMVKDAQSGEFVGCAYVKMSSEAEARDAILCLDGARPNHRELVVVEARPQKSAGSKGPAAKAQTAKAKRPSRASADAWIPDDRRSPADSPGSRGPKRPADSGRRKSAGPGFGSGKGRKPGKGGGRGK